MKFVKTKIIMFIILFVSLVFVSNNYGILDIEKTAIITAIAIDYDDEKEEYETTAQIAVPEATDVNSENKKAQITTTGKTIASAIKHIGSDSGWFPQLYFCNLIILGNQLSSTNSIKILDYFAKSLRVQDSACVVLAEGKAKELLDKTSPLDSIASFAIQKMLLKDEGIDKDIMTINIKDFAKDYYSISSSSYMPIISINEQAESNITQGNNNNQSSQSQGQNSSSQENKTCLFDGKKTALFYKGLKVGELNREQTFAYNIINQKCIGSEIVVENVYDNNETKNVLTIIDSNKYKKYLTVDDYGIMYNIDLKLKVRISDQTATSSDTTYAKGLPLPENIKQKMVEDLKERFSSLLEKEKKSNCDFLKIKENIYRFHTKYYEKFKDNFLERTTMNINIEII